MFEKCSFEKHCKHLQLQVGCLYIHILFSAVINLYFYSPFNCFLAVFSEVKHCTFSHVCYMIRCGLFCKLKGIDNFIETPWLFIFSKLIRFQILSPVFRIKSLLISMWARLYSNANALNSQLNN